jgi:hypothetical protein
MTDILWTGWMGRSATTLGWETHTVRFSQRQVSATVALASYLDQNGERFAPFQPRYARCWIETEKTPMISAGPFTFPNPDVFADVQVWIDTTWLTFQLQTNGVGGGAVETIFDMSNAGAGVRRVANHVQRIVHDEGGKVVGIHRETQLEGGADLDEAAIDNSLLARAAASHLAGLRVIQTDLDAFPSSAQLRVDAETGKVYAE